MDKLNGNVDIAIVFHRLDSEGNFNFLGIITSYIEINVCIRKNGNGKWKTFWFMVSAVCSLLYLLIRVHLISSGPFSWCLNFICTKHVKKRNELMKNLWLFRVHNSNIQNQHTVFIYNCTLFFERPVKFSFLISVKFIHDKPSLSNYRVQNVAITSGWSGKTEGPTVLLF